MRRQSLSSSQMSFMFIATSRLSGMCADDAILLVSAHLGRESVRATTMLQVSSPPAGKRTAERVQKERGQKKEGKSTR